MAKTKEEYERLFIKAVESLKKSGLREVYDQNPDYIQSFHANEFNLFRAGYEMGLKNRDNVMRDHTCPRCEMCFSQETLNHETEISCPWCPTVFKIEKG